MTNTFDLSAVRLWLVPKQGNITVVEHLLGSEQVGFKRPTQFFPSVLMPVPAGQPQALISLGFLKGV